MEATLPISVAIKPGEKPSALALAPGVMPTATPAATSLPLRFMACGLLSLLFGMGWLAIHPEILTTYHYNANAVAVTHLFVLGWILTTVMGAMYQLVPVALETRLYSERLARWQFIIHLTGFVGMVWMFRSWDMKQVGHFGSVLFFGLGLFTYNITRTLFRAPKWNVVASAITAALCWIVFAAVAGLSIAAAKCVYESIGEMPTGNTVSVILRALRAVAGFVSHFSPLAAMHAHAHLGVVGFFIMLIVGVSYKLVPMFTLSEVQSPRRAALSVGLLNMGLAGTFLSVLLQSAWKPVFALVIIIALAIYGFELAAILRARKRSTLDWGIRYFLTAIGMLAPLCLLGLFLSKPGLGLPEFNGQLENIYGFLALIGVVTFAILGMFYKIVPFLVWFGVYSGHIGKARVPPLTEMYSVRLQAAGYWLYLGGLLTSTAGALFRNELVARSGCILLGIGVATVLVNLGLVVRHYFRPQLQPITKSIPRTSPA